MSACRFGRIIGNAAEMEADVFGVILVLAVTLMQVYVFWRAASVPFVRRRISRKRLIGIGVALWMLFVFGRVIGAADTGRLAAMLEFLGMVWLGMLFLMSTTLLAVEVVGGFGFFLKRFAPALRGAALVAGAVLSLAALVQGLRAPVVQDYDIYLDGLPGELDGMVIVALSDLHLGTLLGERWLATRVEQVQAERPDVVVLLGDVFEGHSAPGKELLATLRRLSAPQGVWAVLGNHEFHGNHADHVNINALFEEAGVRLLRNAWVELRPGLVLAGVDNLATYNSAGAVGASLAKTLAGRPAGVTVLLSHAPLPASSVVGKGVGLMLSGHTHGGQLWPFGYLVRQQFPLIEGIHALGDMTIVISRGTGTWGPRMRLWRPAEIVRVTLHGGEKSRAPASGAQAAMNSGARLNSFKTKLDRVPGRSSTQGLLSAPRGL